MPFPYSSELIQIMSARSGPAPVLLLDVVAMDGTSYHWANKQIEETPVYPSSLPGTAPTAWLAGLAHPPANYDTHYFPWLLSASGFSMARAQQAVQASISVQNISGDTLERDLAGMLMASTFEGALYCLREWNLLKREAEFEAHGRLTVVNAGERACTFGAGPLFNPNDYDGQPNAYSETCPWTFGDRRCGSTPTNDTAYATPCDNTFTTCHQENRFGGELNTVVFPNNPNTAVLSQNQVIYRRLV